MMNPIERNDPYETPRSPNLNSMLRSDPAGIPPLLPAQVVQDAFYYVRIGGVLLGAIVVLSGVYFAAQCFDIVSDVLRSPQQLNAYLDECYIPPKEAKQSDEQSPTGESADSTHPGADDASNSPAAEVPAATAPMAAEATPPPSGGGPEAVRAGTTAEEAQKEIDRLQEESELTSRRQKELERLKEQAAEKALERRNAPVKANKDSPFAQSIELLGDALTRGGLPRLAGAIIIVLLSSMLIRIPFGLIKAGIEIVKASLPERSRTNP